MADPANSVAVATGSLVVTGTLTSFVAAENDLFTARGAAVPIARRDGPNQITLKQPWPLASLTGETGWSILSLGEYWRSAISINKRLVELLGKWEVVSPFRFDEAGPLSGRAAYNDQPKGFVYAAVDQTPIQIFIKLANTNSNADWSAPIYIGIGGQIEFDQALALEKQQREAAVSAERQARIDGDVFVDSRVYEEAEQRVAGDLEIDRRRVEAVAAEAETRSLVDDQAFQTALAMVMGALADAGISKRQPVQYRYSNTTGIAAPAWDRILYVIPIMGQSLALGATAGAPVATTPIYPGRALMPDGNVHTYGSLAGLRDLAEATFLNSIQETVASSMVNHLIRDLDAVNPGIKPRIATFVSAIGDRGYFQLKQGSGPYTWAMSALDQICRMEEPFGARIVVPAVAWIGGENDVPNGNRYERMMAQFQRHLSLDIRQITGQTEEPILFLDQVNKVIETLAAGGQPIQNAQLAAGRHPFIRCAGSKYPFPVNPADRIHKVSVGANQEGQQLARAILAECFGTGWRPLEPMDAYFISRDEIEISVHVPVEPLVDDTSGSVIGLAGMRSVKGFTAFDAAGKELAIASVTIQRASTTPLGSPPLIRVKLAAPPPTPTVVLGYAQRRDSTDDINTDDGPVTGARGPFRDSAAHPSLYGQPPQHNFMVQWSRRIVAANPPGALSF